METLPTVPLDDFEFFQRVLDAPMLDDGWLPVLDDLRARFDAPFPGLMLRTPWQADPGVTIAPALGEAMAVWPSLFEQDEALQREVAEARPGQIRRLPQEFDRSVIENSTVLRNWQVAGGGLPWVLHLMLWADGPQAGFLGLHREGTDQPFAPEAAAQLERFARPIMRAVQIHRRLEWLQIQRDAAHEVLDHIPVGVVLSGEKGEVVHLNRVAGEIIEERDGVELEQDRLRPSDPRSRHAYEEALGETTEVGAGNALDGGGDTTFVRPSNRRPVRASLVPIGRDSSFRWHSDRPLTATFLSDPERRGEVPVARLQRIYDLTPAEAALAQTLATGTSLELAGERLGRGRHTVRKQLQSIFEKTDTHRQGELVALLGSLASPMGASDEEPDPTR